MIYTAHTRAWWREHLLHELALRRLRSRAARRRTPSRWLVAS